VIKYAILTATFLAAIAVVGVPVAKVFVILSAATLAIGLALQGSMARTWCKSEHYWDVMFDLNKSIKEAFDKNGITIPYPTSIELDG